jgi:hypothetical protein
MQITYFFFTVLQVEETDFDRLHSEQQTQGDNKYSTIQKVCKDRFVNHKTSVVGLDHWFQL